MVSTRYPVAFWTPEQLQQTKNVSRETLVKQTITNNPPCGTCYFQAVCFPSAPCAEFFQSPFLPLHILKATVVLKLPVATATLYGKGRKMKIKLKNGMVKSFSLVCFCNGAEALQNLKLCLQKDKRFQQAKKTCESFPVNRWNSFLVPYYAVQTEK